MAPQLNIQSLGELRVSLDDQPISFGSNKATALLVYLLGTGRSQSREVLAELLYEGYPQKDAMGNFRRELSVVRTALPDMVDSNREFAWLNTGENIWFDFAELEAGLISIPEYLTAETALEIQQQISELFVGDFLEGFPDIGSAAFEQWVVAERDRLKRRVQNGLQALANYFIQHGHYDAGLETTEKLLKLDELDEEAYRLQMIALAQSGQRANAIRVFQTLSKILEQELDLEPDVEAVAIFERIRAGDSLDDYFSEVEAVNGYQTASGQIPNNLPQQLTPFVGRSKEIEQFLNLMIQSRPRLVTIEGSGGIGKTRFALKLAEQLMSQFSDGVYFVPLADLGSPEQIVPKIAESMDIDLYGDQRPESELSEYIAGKKILLLLDNFENVADGAEIVFDILGQTSQLTIIITSRERLRLRGETSFPIDGLDYPRSDEDALDILEIDSGRLFLQSARRVDPGFEPLSEDLLPVTNICRIVRGMPLAIELATGYINMLTPAEILHELNHNGIDMLVTDDFNIPDRQKSIVAIFDWSWDRLSLSEQEALTKLAVFRGGFTRDAAQAVAGAGLRMLNILVSMSLIYREGRGRYEIHELMGQFLQMKLAENADLVSSIHQAHCRYFSSLLDENEGDILSGHVKEIIPDFENIYHAWHFAISDINLKAIGRLREGLWALFDAQSWHHEGAAAFKLAINALETDDPQGEHGINYGRCLALYGYFLGQSGNLGAGYKMAHQGTLILRDLNATEEYILSASLLGPLATSQTQRFEAKELIEDQLNDILNESSITRIGSVLVRYGELIGLIGNPEEAEHILQQGGERERAHNRARGLANVNLQQGKVDRQRGRHELAREKLLKSLSEYESLGYGQGVAWSLNGLGRNALDMNNLPQAGEYFMKALQTARDIDMAPILLDSLVGLAEVLYKAGKPDETSIIAFYVLDHKSLNPETRQNVLKLIETLSLQMEVQSLAIIQTRATQSSITQITALAENNLP